MTVASTDMDPRDLELLDELRVALTDADPVPDAVVASGKAALTWLTIDAELAMLAEESGLAGVRSTTTDRVLTFECDSGVITFEVGVDGDLRHLMGQTDRPADLEIHHRGAPVATSTDRHGRFRAANILAGPVSVRCTFYDSPGTPVVTSWVIV